MVQASVIVCTHNPHPDRLRQTLAGLRAQSLPNDEWETLLVDNASTSFPTETDLRETAPANLRILRELALGLSAARRCGLRAARADTLILVDDDNVLDPDYLSCARRILAAEPRLGMVGGKSIPRFETLPPAWIAEYHDLLAIRDLGELPIIAASPENDSGPGFYPACAPVGAGMVIRREAIGSWMDDRGESISDRRGVALSSGGDNDMVFSAWKAGWAVGYDPTLRLTHLIPTGRTTGEYLARLNRGIRRSWTQVLARHNVCPWKPIARWTVPLRAARAWLKARAWQSPQAFVHWQGLVGQFEGQADIRRKAATS